MLIEEFKNNIKEMDLDQINTQLKKSCVKNDLETIKFLLKNNEVKEKLLSTNKKLEIQSLMKISCLYKHTNLLEYLLITDDIKEKTAIDFDDNTLIKKALENEDIPTINMLLTSTKLVKKADIHIDNDELFLNTCYRMDTTTIKYLIFDYKIKKTMQISKIIQYPPLQELELDKLFQTRDTYEQINSSTPEKEEKLTSKIKI